MYIRLLVSPKIMILPLLYLYAHIFGLLKTHLQMKVSLSSWNIHPQIVLNSYIIFQICQSPSSTASLLRFPQTHHLNQLIAVLSISMSMGFPDGELEDGRELEISLQGVASTQLGNEHLISRD